MRRSNRPAVSPLPRIRIRKRPHLARACIRRSKERKANLPSIHEQGRRIPMNFVRRYDFFRCLSFDGFRAPRRSDDRQTDDSDPIPPCLRRVVSRHGSRIFFPRRTTQISVRPSSRRMHFVSAYPAHPAARPQAKPAFFSPSTRTARRCSTSRKRFSSPLRTKPAVFDKARNSFSGFRPDTARP